MANYEDYDDEEQDDGFRSNKLTWCYLILIFVGLIQVYSSSFIYALENYNDGLFFFKKQVIFVLLSLSAFYISGRVPFKYFKYLGYSLFLIASAGLALTFVAGVKVGGATRWLNLPMGFRIEPGEFLKVGYGFFLFGLMTLKEKYPDMSFWWPLSIVTIGFAGAFLKQPDFGSLILMVASLSVVLFLKIKNLKPFILVSLVLVGGLGFFLTQESYRMDRVKTFLNPWEDPSGKGFQSIQSFVAFKKGGLFGEGLGQSQSKFFFLPEAHTDFTLAVFAEELGFVGMFALMAVFMTLVFELLRIGREQVDEKKMFLSYYLASLFFFYFFINVCVNIGLLPAKGLPLPFFSYGGSSLLALTFLICVFRSFELKEN